VKAKSSAPADVQRDSEGSTTKGITKKKIKLALDARRARRWGEYVPFVRVVKEDLTISHFARRLGKKKGNRKTGVEKKKKRIVVKMVGLGVGEGVPQARTASDR